jgi:hypothetical protein
MFLSAPNFVRLVISVVALSYYSMVIIPMVDAKAYLIHCNSLNAMKEVIAEGYLSKNYPSWD